MEPPAKRQKVGRNLAGADQEDDDELSCAPDELNQRRDPAFQLHKGRALAANKLKFKFEEIIAKYSRDFTGIGDEIDLVTGEVVVDNGHVRSMRSQKDTGDGEDADENSDEEEARILRGVRAADRASGSDPASSTIRRDPWEVAGPSWPMEPAMGAPRLTSMLSSQSSFMSPSQSFSPFGYRDPMAMSVDPVWQAPDLPESAFANRFGANGHQLALGMAVPSRTMVKKALPPLVSPDSDDEDVLLGVSGNVVRKSAEKESPLIKEKFPTIDSPNDDPVFNDFINDLIENPPSTPPSIKRPKPTRPRCRPSKLKETQTAGTGVVPEERPRTGGGRDAEADSGAGDIDESHTEPSWEEEDLMNFNDVTGRSVQPIGQALFVDIRTTKNRSSESSATENQANNLQIANAQLSTRNGEPVTTGTDAKKPSTAIKKQRPQEKFKRNTIDPAFGFSDEENMLPKKERKARRRSEPAKIAAVQDAQEAAAPPESQATFERNTMDASYGFSDDERLLPKRPNRGKWKSELAAVAEDVSEEARSIEKTSTVKTLTKSEAAMETTEATQRTSQPVSKSKTISQRQTARSAKGNEWPPENESPKIVQTIGTTGPQPRRRKSQGRVAAQIAPAGLQTTKQKAAQTAPAAQSLHLAAALVSEHSGVEPAIDKLTPKSEGPNPTDRGEAAPTRAAKPRPRRASSTQKSSGPGATSPPDTAAPAAPEPMQPAPRPTDSPTAATAAASAATAAAAAAPQQQPSTPQRPSKGHTKATPPSALDLISLLSDSDDDEDEISFDLADFTPSGHHRILIHRPFPRLAASASSHSYSHSTSTTKNDNNNSSSIRKNKNKKKRASLFGPYASASARKLTTTTPRGDTTTPGSAGRRAHSTSKKNERKDKKARARDRDSIGLPRSVVHAHRRGGDDTHNSRAPSPTGSVVQTPGGTKRRCGADGFQCDRDFCFVCL